ncbi:1557_t:CDS:2, partial [Gigaspora rosea]
MNTNQSVTNTNENQVTTDMNIAANMNMEFNENTVADKNTVADLNIVADVNIAADIYNPEFFETFLKMVKDDYENCGPQLRAALEKIAERYNAAKAKSIPALTSFLYNMNPGTDPLVHVKSGAKICVQVESIKHRKTGNKKNQDPQVIPIHKVRAISKKKHNLSQNISRNNLN